MALRRRRGRAPPGASQYASPPGTTHSRSGREATPTDLVLFYTGGTTGLPKGVVWQQDELFRAETADLEALDGAAPGDVGISLTRKLHAAGAVSLPASPLMHGTGFYSQLGVLSFGGAVVTLESRSFDPVELFDAVKREQV